MRFRAEHRFAAPPAEVAAVLTDGRFYAGLDLPDVGRPEVLEESHTAEEAALRLRYEFAGHLDPIAIRVIGSLRLTWTQEVRIALGDGSGTLHFEADADPRRLHGRADLALAGAGGGTVRRLDGELVVAVPAVGRMAERRILAGVLRRLDEEAAAVERRLAGPG